MANQPLFPSVPLSQTIQFGTANTSRTGSGTVGTDIFTLWTSTVNGTIVNKILCAATVTTTAGMLRLFRSPNGGTNKYLIDEVPVAALSVTATQRGWTGRFMEATFYRPIIMAKSTSDILYVTTEKAETFTVMAEGGELT